MEIRRATMADFSEIARVQAASWKDAYRDILSADYLATKVDEDLRAHWAGISPGADDCVLVADNGAICGFIAIWVGEDAFIDNLHVLPNLRGQGIGKALMREGAKALLEQGRNSAYLWVLSDNTPAIAFYKNLHGVVTQQAPQDLFGEQKPHFKVEWPDLSVIVEKTERRNVHTH